MNTKECNRFFVSYACYGRVHTVQAFGDTYLPSQRHPDQKDLSFFLSRGQPGPDIIHSASPAVARCVTSLYCSSRDDSALVALSCSPHTIPKTLMAIIGCLTGAAKVYTVGTYLSASRGLTCVLTRIYVQSGRMVRPGSKLLIALVWQAMGVAAWYYI